MCNHEHLRTVGDRLFCKDCGQELPIEFLTAGAAQKPTENPAPDQGTEKPTVKKARAKKPVKKGE